MDAAEVIDSLRIFPRILAVGYAALVGVTAYWYFFRLAAPDRTVEVTAVTGGIFTLAPYVFKSYTDGGRDWDKYNANPIDQRLPVSDPPNRSG